MKATDSRVTLSFLFCQLACKCFMQMDYWGIYLRDLSFFLLFIMCMYTKLSGNLSVAKSSCSLPFFYGTSKMLPPD